MLKILNVVGTRPEAIKLAPVIKEVEKYPGQIESRVCVTGQHREMLDQILEIFSIRPDFDLNLMTQSQTLAQLAASLLKSIETVFDEFQPDLVLVQGDTTTAMTTSMVAFYHNIPVGHVEAGLRSNKMREPFPEEMNRRVATLVSTYHFAPTLSACMHLLKEGVPSSKVHITGNTVIDALYKVTERPHQWIEKKLGGLNDKIILVTAHRRENFSSGLEKICSAISELSKLYPDVSFVYPVPLNPKVSTVVSENLGGLNNVLLTGPLNYLDFCHLMKKSYLILCDSGGVQEQAPALDIPVLVLRNVTERTEAVESGAVKLVGTNPEKIVKETKLLLSDKAEYIKMKQAKNPYGDGAAAAKIVRFIANEMNVGLLQTVDSNNVKKWPSMDSRVAAM
jgi:UDP-N-acetylglucosamine 2-epimerase (non-hydrolysing)